MILKLGVWHRGLKLYKVHINDDPGLTLTYLQQGQIESLVRLNGENCYKVINGGQLKVNDFIDPIILLLKKMTPRDCLPLLRGCKHVHNHYIQTSSSLKHLAIQYQGRENESLCKWSRAHDQDGHHAHIW